MVSRLICQGAQPSTSTAGEPQTAPLSAQLTDSAEWDSLNKLEGRLAIAITDRGADFSSLSHPSLHRRFSLAVAVDTIHPFIHIGWKSQ